MSIELILNNLFRLNVEVPNEVIAEMQHRIKSETANWKARIRRMEQGARASPNWRVKGSIIAARTGRIAIYPRQRKRRLRQGGPISIKDGWKPIRVLTITY